MGGETKKAEGVNLGLRVEEMVEGVTYVVMLRLVRGKVLHSSGQVGVNADLRRAAVMSGQVWQALVVEHAKLEREYPEVEAVEEGGP